MVEAILQVTKVSNRNKSIITAEMLRNSVSTAVNVKVCCCCCQQPPIQPTVCAITAFGMDVQAVSAQKIHDDPKVHPSWVASL